MKIAYLNYGAGSAFEGQLYFQIGQMEGPERGAGSASLRGVSPSHQRGAPIVGLGAICRQKKILKSTLSFNILLVPGHNEPVKRGTVGNTKNMPLCPGRKNRFTVPAQAYPGILILV